LLLGSGEAPLAGEETAADLLAAARLVASGA
jgi:hypothetical protein